MSRVTFAAGRWPLVAGLPLPKASPTGDRVMTAGEWVFLLANGGGCEGNGRWERGTDLRRRWRRRDDRKEERSSRDSVWDLLPGSLTGRTRNGSNPLADSIRLGPTLTWTKDSILAAQPTEVTPRRAHNDHSWKFTPSFSSRFQAPDAIALLRRNTPPTRRVPALRSSFASSRLDAAGQPLRHLGRSPARTPKVSNYFEFLDVRF